MNRQLLRESCERRFGDTANAVRTDDEWNDYLAEGERRVHGSSPLWPWLEHAATTLTISAGANDATLPTYAYRVLSAFNDTDQLILDEMHPNTGHLHMFPEGAASTGVPEWNRLLGSKLYVYPYAEVQTSVKIEYLGAPTVMASDSDEPTFPQEYHQMLVHFALAQTYLDDENPALSEQHMAQFDRMLSEMKANLLSARGDSYPAVIDNGWW